MLNGAASACADHRKVVLHAALGANFLLVPLLDSHDRADHVIGVADGDPADLPMLLHELHENLRYFSQTIHLLPQAVLTARRDGTFDYASRRWYAIIGEPVESSDVEGSLKRAAGGQAAFFERNWLKGIAGGELFAFEIPLETERGVRWFEFRAAPSYDGNRLRKWIVTLDDVHERIQAQLEVGRARARLAALADLGRVVLEQSLTDEELMEQALGHAAAAVDAAWIASVTINGRTIVRTHPKGARIELDSLESADVNPNVVRTPIEFGEPGNHYLAVVRARDREPFDQFDADFVRDVAWRIASALRNLTEYRREARIARVLQTAMLPVALPRAPGVSFDVSYVTAEVETLIGGDWYDAFELRDGRLAFSIGDVAGHGLDAAVVMGHVREIVRALALRGASPSDVLEETNGVVLAAGYGLITAVVAYLDPETFVVEYACAGHPPPVRVEPGGTVETLEHGDVILGAVPRARFRSQSLRLRPDDALVLYTDGLVEFAHNSVAGEAKLHAVLAQWAREDFAVKASQLVERVLDGAPANDDVALLIVRTRRTPATGHYVNERRTPARSAADSRS